MIQSFPNVRHEPTTRVPELDRETSIKAAQDLLAVAMPRIGIDKSMIGNVAEGDWVQKNWIPIPAYFVGDKTSQGVNRADVREDKGVKDGWVKEMEVDGLRITVAVEPHNYNGRVAGKVVVDIQNTEYSSSSDPTREAIPYVLLTSDLLLDRDIELLRNEKEIPVLPPETIRFDASFLIGVQPQNNFDYISLSKPTDFQVRFGGSTNPPILGEWQDRFDNPNELILKDRHSARATAIRIKAFTMNKTHGDTALMASIRPLIAEDLSHEPDDRVGQALRHFQSEVAPIVEHSHHVDAIFTKLNYSLQAIAEQKRDTPKAVETFIQALVATLLTREDLLSPLAKGFEDRLREMPKVSAADMPYIHGFRAAIEYKSRGQEAAFKHAMERFNLPRQAKLARMIASRLPVRDGLDYHFLLQNGEWEETRIGNISVKPVRKNGEARSQHEIGAFIAENAHVCRMNTIYGTMEVGVASLVPLSMLPRAGEVLGFRFTPKTDNKGILAIEYIESDITKTNDKMVSPTEPIVQRGLKIQFSGKPPDIIELHIAFINKGEKLVQFWKNKPGSPPVPITDPEELARFQSKWEENLVEFEYDNIENAAYKLVDRCHFLESETTQAEPR